MKFVRRSAAVALSTIFAIVRPFAAKALDTSPASVQRRAGVKLGNERNIWSPADLQGAAIKALSAEGTEYYAFERVEVTGIFADDDGTSDPENLFDKRITPAQWGRSGETVAPWLMDLLHKPQDLMGLATDSAGNLSKYAESAISQMKDVEINEIVAHSWGAEVMYNAIFLGLINPPKKLILCGVTEFNWEKWQALAAYTGTEVVVYNNVLDPAAISARSLDAMQKIGLTDGIKLTDDPHKLDSSWSEQCEKRKNCNPHQRQGRFMKNTYIGKPSHSRETYYARMLDDHLIRKNVSEKTAVYQELLAQKENDLFQEQLAEVRETIRASDAEFQATFDAQVADIRRENERRKQAEAISAAARLQAANVLALTAVAACEGNAAMVASLLGKGGMLLPPGRPDGADEAGAPLQGCARSVFDWMTQNQPDARLITPKDTMQAAAMARPPETLPSSGDTDEPPQKWRPLPGNDCGVQDGVRGCPRGPNDQ